MKKNENIIIREAIFDDILQIEILIETGYRREEARKGWTHEIDILSGDRLDKGEIEGLFNKSNVKFFVAIDETSKVQGVISVTKDGDWIEFGKFAVNPILQGLGIGKMLIKTVEEFVKNQWNSNVLLLSVISTRKELIEFYKRIGFKETGQEIDFIKIHPKVILKNGVKELKVLIMKKNI